MAFFAELLARLGADDRDLQNDLKRAEKETKESGQRMQKNLNQVSIGAADASAASATLGKAAASMGGAFGGALGQGIAFQEMLGSLSIGMSAVTAGFVSGAAAVVIYRDEIVKAIESAGVWLGVLDDLDAKQKRVNTSLESQQKRLEEIGKRQDIERKENISRVQLEMARRGDFEGLKSFDLELQARKIFEGLPASEREGVQGAANLRTITRDLANKNRVAELKAQAQQDDAAQKAAEAKAKADADRRIQEARARTDRLVAQAQALIVATGTAPASSFITDPTERRLTQLSERLTNLRSRPAGASDAFAGGTFGQIDASSRFATIKAGEVLGQQTLTVAEEHKRISEEELRISREVRDLLDKLVNRATGNQASTPASLRISESVN